MKNKVFKISVILVMILTMTMTNFIFVGANLISYAIDDNSTNHSNVEFSSYFKNEKGERITSLDMVTSKLQDSLFMEIAVKKEGYLNGNVQLENTNFKLISSDSQYVNKIENNVITLNQINAGTTAEIEVKIEFEKNPEFKMDLLNMESTVQLRGIYKDSSQKDKEIDSSKKVTLRLISDVKTENLVNDLKIITNKTLKINGQDKRVLQVSLKAGMKENSYPMKNVAIEVTIPKVGDVNPIVEENTKLNNMTNKNFEYDGSIAKINLTNENGQWKANGTEEIILTYVYEAETSLDEVKIQANQKMELYDGTNMEATTEVIVKDSEESDATISAEVSNSENSIYKGKLQAGIDRTYKNTTNINVNLVGVVQETEVQEQPSNYADIYYTQTKINKEQLMNIVGEQGNLSIVDQDGNHVQTINNTTEADQDGNIIITYAENTVKGIVTKVTNIEKIGTISLEHTKVIKTTDREMAKTATAIEANVVVGENSYQQSIQLVDTKTDAKLTMNKSSLSTLTANNVEINAILKSAKEENDLYKNPKVQIILPEEIKDIQINSIHKLYGDELQTGKAALVDGKVIEIELLGEQTDYLNEISEGIQIVINANINFDIAMPSKKSSITMKYTNENGKEGEQETTVDFDIVSKYGVLVHSKAQNYNEDNTVLESTSDENLKGELDTAKGEKIVNIERSIVNNYEEPITNIALVGTLPEEETEKINGETLKSTFLADLEKVATNTENTKIYYSEDSKEWKETIEEVEKVKAYKIELQDKTIKSGEVASINYELKIPENLTANESTYEKLNLSYQYKDQVIKEDYATYLSTNSVETTPEQEAKQENVNGLGKITVVATSAGQEVKDGQEIYEGQTIKQTVKITNDTGKEIKNLKITAKQENAIFYVKQVTQEFNTATGEDMDVTNVIEDETVKQQEVTAETIKNGETVTFTYQYSVHGKVGDKTEGTVEIQAEGMETQTIKTVSNPIKEAKLKLNVTCNYNEERIVVADSALPITLSTKNISDKELKNVMIELPLTEDVTLEEEGILESKQYDYVGIANQVAKFKIASIKPEEQIDIVLTLKTKDFKEKETVVNLAMKSTVGNETYTSNELERKVVQDKLNITVVQTGSKEGKQIETGEELVYTTTIKNNSEEEQEIRIIDHVPSPAVVQKAYIVSDGQQTQIEDIENNEIDTKIKLLGKTEIKFVVETVIDEKLAETKELTNIVEVNAYSQYLESNKITYQLANVPDDKETQNQISGQVWLDENKDGQREAGEKTFADVAVKVIDTANGNTIKEGKTDSEGKYQFAQLPNGKYIVMVEYDNKQYSLTEYRKEGINEDVNSDAIEKEVNGQKVAVTDEIEINDSNASNIDIGLVKNVIFDLKLDKYLNRVIIQNAGGTKTIEYNKQKLGKAEIDAKQVNNSTVLVEYGIDVTNEGEIAGYASEIVDHMPNDFKFNSELNKSWYTTNDKDIHNITLANEIIYPGETKTITVTLVKTMTQNNAGTSINTAEIAKASNEQLIEDIDSTPGNNASNEDDISTAELIISIRTGLGIAIGVIVAIVLVGLIITAVIIIKKRRGKNE